METIKNLIIELNNGNLMLEVHYSTTYKSYVYFSYNNDMIEINGNCEEHIISYNSYKGIIPVSFLKELEEICVSKINETHI
ncbi:MAG: hypothetical protein RSE41_09055 [Clostridia bacterium]